MKRFLILVLAALMALTICATASAESSSARSSNYFASYGTSITPIGSGKISITFTCASVGTADQLGVDTYSIHQYVDGSWTLVAGPLNGSSSSNATSHSFAKTFSGKAGQKYKVTCSFFCTKDGVTETKSHTSATVTAN